MKRVVLKTTELADALGWDERKTQRVAAVLESNGIIAKAERRSGWRLTEAGMQFIGANDEPKSESETREVFSDPGPEPIAPPGAAVGR